MTGGRADRFLQGAFRDEFGISEFSIFEFSNFGKLFRSSGPTAALQLALAVGSSILFEAAHFDPSPPLAAVTRLQVLQHFKYFKECCQLLSPDPSLMVLTPEEFQSVPAVAVSPLKERFVVCIPSHTGFGMHTGDIDFPAFLRLVNLTNGSARQIDKIRFVFPS